MRGFKSTATVNVTIERPGASVTLGLAAPPFGWWQGLQAAYPKPVKYDNKMEGGKRVTVEVQDKAGERERWDDLAALALGKALHCAGELEQNFPDPLPDVAGLKVLAASIRKELAAANLRDAEVSTLVQAALNIIQGDLPTIEEANAAGND